MKKTTTVKILGALGSLTVLATGVGLTQKYVNECPSLVSGFSSISIEPDPGESPISILLGPETEALLTNICEGAVKYGGGIITYVTMLSVGVVTKFIHDYFRDNPDPIVNRSSDPDGNITEHIELSTLQTRRHAH
jgi:hypothetical protein